MSIFSELSEPIQKLEDYVLGFMVLVNSANELFWKIALFRHNPS